eukprot:RCo026919
MRVGGKMARLLVSLGGCMCGCVRVGKLVAYRSACESSSPLRLSICVNQRSTAANFHSKCTRETQVIICAAKTCQVRPSFSSFITKTQTNKEKRKAALLENQTSDAALCQGKEMARDDTEICTQGV